MQNRDSQSTDSEELLRRLEKGRRRSRFHRIIYLVTQGLKSFVYRAFELLLTGLFLILWTLPCFMVLLLRSILKEGPLTERVTFRLENGKTGEMLVFHASSRLVRRAPLLIYVLKRRLRLFGVTLLEQSEPGFKHALVRREKPGLFSLGYVRESSGITYGARENVEIESAFTGSIRQDLALLLKSLFALLLHSGQDSEADKVCLMEVTFDNVSMLAAVAELKKCIREKQKKRLFFINADCLNKTVKDKAYLQLLQCGELILPDGSGINMACRMINRPMCENVNGTDLLPFLCEMALSEEVGLFLLGGKPGVAVTMSEKLQKAYPGLIISGVRDGYFDWERESPAVVRQINESGAGILLVAFGAPLQETWISDHFDELAPFVQAGVGGLFDFYSGRIKRAPVWMREIGLEWIFRLLMEPKRMWKRYIIGNPLFLLRVWRWKRAVAKRRSQR